MTAYPKNLGNYLDNSQHYYYLLTDLSGNITFANSLFHKKFQHLLGDPHGKSCFMQGYSPDAERMQQHFEAVLKGEPVYQLTEQRISVTPESYTWIKWEVQLLYNEHNELSAIQCMGMDVSACKINELNLKKTANQYKKVFHGSLLPKIIVCPHTLGLKDANRQFIKYSGYSQEEIVNLTISNIFTKSDQQLFNKYGQHAPSEYKNWKMPCNFQTKTGNILTCDVYVTPYFNDDSAELLITFIENFQKGYMRQATILENVSDIIITSDKDGFVTSWNKVAESFYGIRETVALGKNVKDLVTLEYLDTTREQALYELEHTGIWKGEVAFTNKRGEKKYLLNTLSLINDEYGSGIMTLGIDITEHKLAEQKVELSEQFYRNLISNSLDGMLIMSIEGYITFASPSVETILGHTPNELKTLNGFAFVHPDDISKTVEAFNREVKQVAVDKSISVRLRHKDGNFVWCLLRGHNLIENPFVKGVVVYFYDDTHRIKAREILKESESRFRNLITGLQSGVMLLNDQMEIMLCNKMGLQILGYENEQQILGASTLDSNWDIIDENNKPIHSKQRPTYQAYKTHKPVNNVVMGIRQFHTKKRVWVLANAIPIMNQEGVLQHIITSFTDITERRLLEQKLHREEIDKHKLLTRATIEGQEKERVEIGKELHDNIGQQLTTTKLFLEIARSNADGSMLDMIDMALKGITGSINEVRSISHSLVPSTLGDLGLVESIRELCHSLKRSQAFQIRFYHKTFDEATLPANQVLTFYRIIQEQVNNIIKHAEARAVIISLGTEAGNTILEIVDNGKGFDLQHYKKGLGLINIANRAELFNGKLDIQATPDKGCRIKVIIPHTLHELVLN